MTRSHALRLVPAAGLAAIALLAVALFGATARPAQALSNCSISDSAVALDGEEARFLTLINNYRAQNGLGSLSVSTNLNRAAAWMAQDLGANRYFSHTDSAGRSPSTRAQNCGYPSGAGENIAAGTVKDSAQEAFDMWRNSAGHNQNMLNSSYRMIGIARAYVAGSPYGWYWVTDFGLVSDGTSGGGSTGGGSTATPPPPTTAPSTAKASVTSPTPGSILPGSTATFSWSTGSGAQEYFLYVGTAAGSNNIRGTSTGLSRSLSVSNIPTDGRTIYVRLWTRFSSGWQYTDYTYRAATPYYSAPANTSTPAPAITPAPTKTATATATWTIRRRR